MSSDNTSPRERLGGSFAKSFSRLGLNDKLDQARGSLQKLELSTKLETSRRKIAAEMKERRVVERIGESTSKLSSTIRTEMKERRVAERIGDTTHMVGSTVGDATHRIGDRLSHIDVRDATTRLGSAVGGVTNQIGDRLGNIVRSPSNNNGNGEHEEDRQRRERNLKQHLEAEEMMREAEAACTKVIETHLAEFIGNHPTGTYEEWLWELHPDNNYQGLLLEGFSELDHRFYVEGSDHRLLWNRNLDGIRREVPARYVTGSPQQHPGQSGNTPNQVVDLLDLSISNLEQPHLQEEEEETQDHNNNNNDDDDVLLPLDHNFSPLSKDRTPCKGTNTNSDSDLNETVLTCEEDLLL